MTDEPSIREQVWHAIDGAGTTRALVDSVLDDPTVPVWLRSFGVQVDEQWSDVRSLSLEYHRLVGEATDAIRELVPRGWSVFLMDSDVVKKAAWLMQAGRGVEADELLAGQWDGNGEWRTKRVCDRVRVIGAGDPDMGPLFVERARLLQKAAKHHQAGSYEASILILLTQIEGIVIDISEGKKFFTSYPRQKADLVDPSELVSIQAGLAVLQAFYGEGVNKTQTAGKLDRHGILHGRELAYDTRVNSAKAWSVLDALVDWAFRAKGELVGQRTADRQAANADSQEVDETGARVDDREFAETRNAIGFLGYAAWGWHERLGRFRGDLVGGVYLTDYFTKKGLPAQHGVQQATSEDGQQVMYWRETVSGWVLGVAASAEEWGLGLRHYAGPRPPAGFPSETPTGWSEMNGSLPDFP